MNQSTAFKANYIIAQVNWQYRSDSIRIALSNIGGQSQNIVDIVQLHEFTDANSKLVHVCQIPTAFPAKCMFIPSANQNSKALLAIGMNQLYFYELINDTLQPFGVVQPSRTKQPIASFDWCPNLRSISLIVGDFVKIFDIADQKVVLESQDVAQPLTCKYIDSTQLLVGTLSGRLEYFNFAKGNAPFLIVTIPNHSIFKVLPSSDGSQCLCLTVCENRIHLHQITLNPVKLFTYTNEHFSNKNVFDVSVAPHTDFFIVACDGKDHSTLLDSVYVVDMKNHSVCAEFTIPKGGTLNCIQWNPIRKDLFALAFDNILEVVQF